MAPFVLRGLYAIADVASAPVDRDGLLTRAAAVLAAGPCCLQLRAKSLSDGEVCDLARALLDLCRKARVAFCLNDRVDLALLVGADLVHVGQDDLPLPAVRQVIAAAGRSLRVGVSTHSLAQAEAAAGEGADYIGFGPVFATRSKQNPDPVVGPGQLAAVVRRVAVPVVAIGGIHLGNLAEVAATGVAAAAVIAAVWGADEPGQAARAVNAAFATAQPKRPVM